MTTRRRILILLPFTPRLDSRHGGRITAQFLAHLARRHDVALLCIRNADDGPVESALAKLCAFVEEVPLLREKGTLRGLWARRLRLLASLARGRPMWAADVRCSAYFDALRRVNASWAPELVQVELRVMAQYLGALEGNPAPRVLVEHDPGGEAARDLWRASYGRERVTNYLDMWAWRRFVHKTTPLVDAIVVFTQRDLSLVAPTSRGKLLVTISPGFDLPDRALDPRGAGDANVLFVGSYVHPPNVDAAVWLAGSIFPQVKSDHAHAVLYLVGDGPPARLRKFESESVIVTGRVDSVEPYLDQAAVVAAPLRLGGGMRVKVLEALSAGKAVVASTRALEGLTVVDGQHVLVADREDEFVFGISQLLENREMRLALGAEGRRWAVENLSWESRLQSFERLYDRLLGRRSLGETQALKIPEEPAL